MPTVYFPERILHRNTGGNTTYTRTLADHIGPHGWEHGVIPAANNPAATLARESAFALRRRRDAVLHFSADTGPLIRSRTPSVVTVHGIASRWTAVARTPTQERVWRTRVARAIASCDHVITVSQSSADDITHVFGVESDSLTVIPHGIETEKFSSPAALSDEVSAVVPSEFALFVGNVEPRKNLTALVESFEGSSLPLVIAGRLAWNYEETKAAIDRSKNVVYLGFVSDEDRRALLQQCKVFVFPSHYEGFGFPVLEAMAAGAPVVCSSSGSLAEVAGPARRLEGLDAESIADGVSKALSDTAWLAEAPDAGRRWVEGFSWDQSAARHAEVYRRVLEAR